MSAVCKFCISLPSSTHFFLWAVKAENYYVKLSSAKGELMLYPYWLPMPDLRMKIEEKNITLGD